MTKLVKTKTIVWVKFFESDDNGEPVNVFLGEDGVLIKSSVTSSSQAFVLLKGKHMAKKALLKNCQLMGTSLVHITDISAMYTMFNEFSVSPRSNIEVSDEDSKRVVFCNLPSKATERDIENFLDPYDIWVNPEARHYRCRIPEKDYCDLNIAMVSKLVAFFVFIKRNGKYMILGNKLIQIHLKMYGYSNQTEVDSQILNLKSALDQSLMIASHSSESESSPEVLLPENESTDQSIRDQKMDTTDSDLSVMIATDSSEPKSLPEISLSSNESFDQPLQDQNLDTRDTGKVQPPSPDSFFLVCLRNLPVACTAEQVVGFFGSDGPGGCVNVCLGTAGVILQTVYSSTFAYAILQTLDDHCRAMQKNFGKIEDRHVCMENCSLWKAMYLGCNLRSRPVSVPESRQSISLANLPPATTLQDLFTFLHPYHTWLLPNSPNCITSSPHCENEEHVLLRFRSELAAFFVYMNKNHAPIEVKGCRRLVRVTMMSAYSPFDIEYVVPTIQNPLRIFNRPIIPKNITRELPNGRHSWSIVRLLNLPADITEKDVQDLFSGRISVPLSNITLLRATQLSTNATVVFPSIEEGVKAVDNMRSFEIEGHVVSIRICMYSEE